MTPLEELAQELQTLVKKSEQPVYSVAEAAAILECTESSVEAHLRSGRLPSARASPKRGRTPSSRFKLCRGQHGDAINRPLI
jgi:DNA-directed RNA polymerase specialized sigma24 family protein